MRFVVNLVIVMALATQVSHAAWLFNDIGKPNDGTLPWMGWVFALSLETSIFIFTVYGRKGVATFFAVVSTLINLLYYWIEAAVSYKFFAMLVISPIIPTTIWYYSELITLLRAREEEDSAPIGGYYAQPEPAQTRPEPAMAAPQPATDAPQPATDATRPATSNPGVAPKTDPVPVPDPTSQTSLAAKPKRVNSNAKPKGQSVASSAREVREDVGNLIDTPPPMRTPVGDTQAAASSPAASSQPLDPLEDWEITDEADWRENPARTAN